MDNFSLDIPIVGRTRLCLEHAQSQELRDKKIVDVGSSFGWLEAKLIGSNATLIGIEPNIKALTFAQKKLGKKAKFLQGDALNIPLNDGIADIVLLFDVIEHLPRKTEEKGLKEINRVLKKRGLLLLSTPNSHFLVNLLDPAWYFGHRHYSCDKLKFLLKRSGFKVMEIRTKGSGWNMIYLIWFYIMKFFFKQINPQNQYLEDKDDKSYSQDGIFTNYVIAQKK